MISSVRFAEWERTALRSSPDPIEKQRVTGEFLAPLFVVCKINKINGKIKMR